MSYFTNKKNQKIAYKRIKGKSPGIVFIHGLNSNMEGKKAIFIEKYAKKRNYKYIDILGRKGWEKVLNGYNKKAVLLRKEV